MGLGVALGVAEGLAAGLPLGTAVGKGLLLGAAQIATYEVTKDTPLGQLAAQAVRLLPVAEDAQRRGDASTFTPAANAPA